MASPFPITLPASSTRRIAGDDLFIKTTRPIEGSSAAARPVILPDPNRKNVLITSALPYVNNVPHLGNIIGSTLSADCYARYSRSRGRSTLYVCGTDEYGTASETQALKENVTPQQLVDKYHALHAEVYQWFKIGFDHFGRTSTPQQNEIAQEIFLALHKNDFLKEQSVRQLWCPKDERFLADRYVEGICPKCSYDDARGDQCDKCGQLLDAIDLIQPRCKICNATPIQKDSLHMFLRIDTLQPETEEWAKKAAVSGGWSSNSRHITDSWFKEGLRPFSLTRDLKWGVPVPLKGFEGKVLYVWFDAPIGYPSITACYTPEWQQWWRDPDNVRLFQFMGKDNVRFHTVIFPSCLIGTRQRWTKLHHINTTDYLQYESGKFSKSRNIGVFGDKAGTIGVPPDVWRFYLLANRPEAGDSLFSWRDFIARNNNELLANVGNFVNRVLKFLAAKYDSRLPEIPAGKGLNAGPAPLKPSKDGKDAFTSLVRDINDLLSVYATSMDAVKLRLGLQTAMQISQRGNVFLSEVRLDNALFADHKEDCDAAMLLAVNLIYVLSAVLHPFMPDTTDAISQQLDAPPRVLPVEDRGIIDADQQQKFTEEKGPLQAAFAIDLLPGHKIGTPAHLFRRIDEKKEEEWRKMFGGEGEAKAAAKADEKPVISKNKAAKVAKAAKKAAEPKVKNPTPEYVSLEKQVKEQGELVRKLKDDAKKQSSDEGLAENKGDIDEAVSKLLTLKTDLSSLADQLSALEVRESEPAAAA
jgi:methionyl-tRNA synthetase